jgi:hypothetical protein
MFWSQFSVDFDWVPMFWSQPTKNIRGLIDQSNLHHQGRPNTNITVCDTRISILLQRYQRCIRLIIEIKAIIPSILNAKHWFQDKVSEEI